VRVEPPLTIDQHLSNYHESLKEDRYRFDFPSPLSSIAKSHYKKPPPVTPSPTLSPSSSTTSLPSFNLVLDDLKYKNQQEEEQQDDSLFYQHRPLKWTKPTSNFPYTLLHPTQKQEEEQEQEGESDTAGHEPMDQDEEEEEEGNRKPASSGSLLQLAHIVSTFG
jgi:hypothetical protein